MACISEAGLPIRLDVPGGNEPVPFASVDPISRETLKHYLLIENWDAPNPNPSLASNTGAFLLTLELAAQLQLGCRPTPNRKWAPAGASLSALFP